MLASKVLKLWIFPVDYSITIGERIRLFPLGKESRFASLLGRLLLICLRL